MPGENDETQVTLYKTRIKGAEVWEADGYIYWPDGRQRLWRWARKDWLDDGIGLQHHGAAATVEAAVAAARQHAAEYASCRQR